MGCFNSKAKKLKKSAKQLIAAKKKRMAPSRKISSRPRTPTKSMRSDKNNPESLKSYEPSDDEETLIEMKKERQRLLRQLDLRMQASDRTYHTSASASQSVSQTGGSTEGSSSSSQPTASQSNRECNRMPPQLQEEIKSASSSMQSRQLESFGGEKPIQVNAQLYRSSVPSAQPEPPKAANPLQHHPLVANNQVVGDSKPASGENVPEKHPSAGPPSSSLDAPQEQSGKLGRPPSLLRAQEMPQIDKPTEIAGPIPRLLSFRKSPTVVPPTNLAPFPVAPELAPFPGGVKSRKSCSSLSPCFATTPKRALSLTNYTRPPAFGETSPNKGLSFGGTPTGSLTNLARPPAFGETSPKPRSSSGGGTLLSRGSLTNMPRPPSFGETSPKSGSNGGSSLPRQNSLTNRPPFGSNLLPTPLSGPPQPKAVAAANTLLPPPPTFPKGTTLPPAGEMTLLPPLKGTAAITPAPTSSTLPGEASPKH